MRPGQVQAVERTAPVLPMRPGQPERRTHDYVRHGTTDLFAALDAKTGTVIGACHRRHRAPEFRAFLDEIDHNVPPEFEVHLVLDNLRTHKTGWSGTGWPSGRATTCTSRPPRRPG